MELRTSLIILHCQKFRPSSQDFYFLLLRQLKGTLNLSQDGTFTYEFDDGTYSAPTTDSFTYQITDINGTSEIATVTFNISISDSPIVVNDAYVVQDGTILVVNRATGILTNDTYECN